LKIGARIKIIHNKNIKFAPCGRLTLRAVYIERYTYKVTMKIIITIFTLALFLTSFQAASEITQTSGFESVIVELKEANVRLEEQNKMLKASSVELRNSYYSSLAFAATFLIVFLGINIYFFRNRFNEDKNYLLQHIDNEISSKLALTDDFFEKQEQKMVKVIEDQVSKDITGHIASLNGKIGSLQSENRYLTVDIILLKIKNEKTPSNKLTLLMSLSKNYHSLKWDLQLSDTLVEIRDLLEAGASYDSSQLPELARFLDSLPQEFETTIKQVRSRLK